MALSIGGGAAEGLEKILADRFKEALEAQRIREFQQQMQLQQDRLKQDQTQFDQNLGFQREQFGETQLNNEHNRNAVAANLAMRGSEFSRDVANDEAAQNQRLFENAMRGTELASQQNENEADRAFTAGENAKTRASNQAIADTRSAGSGRASGGSAYSSERSQRVLNSVDALLGKANNWTAGAGSMLAAIPGSDATDFAAELDTLKANIAFNELQQMREASKTGGALGAVSERELALLESTLGALNARQSPENLRAQLKQVRDSVLRWQQAQSAGGLGIDVQIGDGAAPGVNTGTRRFNPATGKIE